MRSRFTSFVIAGSAIVAAMLVTAAPSLAASGSSSSWPRYLHDDSGSGFTADGGISAAGVTRLKPAPGWPVKLGGSITTQPIVANGLVYAGAWDGYEYALRRDGSLQWKTYLGRTRNCFFTDTVGQVAGVVSTAAATSELINGSTRPVLYVGGGGNLDARGALIPHPTARLYALDALTGEVLWSTALGSAPGHLSWASPMIYNHSVYMGVSSYNDCPLIQGQLVKLDARSGAIQKTFNVVPTGCEGGSVWGSPVVDTQRGDLYFVTGNARICSILGPQWGRYPHTKRGTIAFILGLLGVGLALVSWRLAFGRLVISLGIAIAALGIGVGTVYMVGPTLSIARPYAISIVKLGAADLQLEGYWHVPASDDTDHDFGTTPTLFQGRVTPDGTQRALVGAVNKDGFYYVFDRADINAGPVARIRIAHGRDTDPTRGNGSISPSAYDGKYLYIAGGMAQLPLGSFAGSVSAFDPSHLERPVWQQGTSAPILGAVTAMPGLLVVGAGSSTVFLDSASGNPVFASAVTSAAKPKPAVIYGAATVANGVIYQGDTYGYLYALTVDGR